MGQFVNMLAQIETAILYTRLGFCVCEINTNQRISIRREPFCAWVYYEN